jgi:methylenetetrahydromethanopterin dehydrogenase
VISLVVRVGFAKLGNIGSAPLLEFLLDERAERQDIDVRVVSSGAKLGTEQAAEVAKVMIELKPDLAVVVSPNATLPGPTKLREMLSDANILTVAVSDGPGKKAIPKMEEKGIGYIIIDADAMIGARREFLDPIEMALFNADIIRVLAITGVFNCLLREIDALIEACKKGLKPTLPKLTISRDKALDAAGFLNPYARAKAEAAHEIARRVADLSVEGCFVVKEWERYTQIVASAHEMMRTAASLADEAREIEKQADTVLRVPHYDDGSVLSKRKLFEKPSKS